MNPAMLIVVAAVVMAVALITKLKSRIRVSIGVDIKDLRAFSAELSERTTNYMRANYSGDPTQLETALGGLLPIARSLVAKHNLKIDDEMLQTTIVTVVAGQRHARRADVEAKLQAVMEREKSAA